MRFLGYFGLLIAVAGYMLYSQIEHSKANLKNDPSSMAWFGFLPFLWPIFVIEAGKWVVPFAVVSEIVLFACRRIWRK